MYICLDELLTKLFKSNFVHKFKWLYFLKKKTMRFAFSRQVKQRDDCSLTYFPLSPWSLIILCLDCPHWSPNLATYPSPQGTSNGQDLARVHKCGLFSFLIQKTMSSYVYTHAHSSIIHNSYFIKQPKYLLIDEWINKMQTICTVKYYLS